MARAAAGNPIDSIRFQAVRPTGNRPAGYCSSETIHSTMTAKRQQVPVRSSATRASFPMTSPFVLVSAELKRDALAAPGPKLFERKDMLNFAATTACNSDPTRIPDRHGDEYDDHGGKTGDHRECKVGQAG